MTEEKILGLKQEEPEAPSGDDQPEKESRPEDLEREIDQTIQSEDTEPKIEDVDDDKVLLSKKDLEKIKEERDNYKKGLISIKPKLKALKKAILPEKEKSEFLTKSEYRKGIERRAIKIACADPDINDNWDKIMEYYVAAHGKETIEDIVTDIERAHRLFRVDVPVKKDDDGDKKTTMKIAVEETKPLGKSEPLKGKEVRKRILPKRTPVQEWYGKEEN